MKVYVIVVVLVFFQTIEGNGGFNAPAFFSEPDAEEHIDPCFHKNKELGLQKNKTVQLKKELKQKQIELGIEKQKITNCLNLMSQVHTRSCKPVSGIPKPNGSTGCTGRSKCWRFCEGSTGKWCYTGSCNDGNEQCAYKTMCTGRCSGNCVQCEDCVDSC